MISLHSEINIPPVSLNFPYLDPPLSQGIVEINPFFGSTIYEQGGKHTILHQNARLTHNDPQMKGAREEKKETNK